MPTLKEFGEAAKKLPLVSGYKKMGDGIDVMVEGEPIYIEYTPAKGFMRHDFTISVPLGKTVKDAVSAFNKMLKMPFKQLEKKYGRSAVESMAMLGIDTTVSDKLVAAGYDDLAHEVLAAGAEIPEEIRESFNAMTQLANQLEQKAKMLKDRQWHFLAFYTKQGKKAAKSIVPVMKVFATDIADLAKEAAGLTKTVKDEFSQEPKTILRRRAAAEVEE
jgi:gas vesicle protein